MEPDEEPTTLQSLITTESGQETQSLAEHIHRASLERNYGNGHGTQAVMAASVYLAERIHGHPRTIQEIADQSGEQAKDIGSAVVNIKSGLGLEIAPETPENYIPRICDSLGLPDPIQKTANDLITDASEVCPLNGKPSGIAAAAVYVVAKDVVLQKDVGNAAGVEPSTIRRWESKFGDRGVNLEQYHRGTNTSPT